MLVHEDLNKVLESRLKGWASATSVIFGREALGRCF